jgi:lipopolysaccharide/colanic/teichoic acid biosynthesis glycosyltransferase
MKPRLTGERWVTSDQKRALDITATSLLLPAALPVGALALGAARALDGKGAIYTQERFGQDGESFLIKKIRSMKSANPGQEARGLDTEITPLGRLIRPLGIDEIPQLLNILRGDMSIVGPRAFQAIALEWMEHSLPRPVYEEWEHVYLSSRPGGMSSFNIRDRGKATANETTIMTKALMDIDDFRNASLRHDLGILRHAGGLGVKMIFGHKPTAKDMHGNIDGQPKEIINDINALPGVE